MHTGDGWFPTIMAGPLMWILWVLLGLLVFLLLRSLFRVDARNGPVTGGRADTPLLELQRRFARGEIDEEEFLRRRQLLQEMDDR